MIKGNTEKTDVPTEVLYLRDPESFIARGRIRVRIEVMSSQAALSRPVESLPSSSSQNLELRIAIFGTRHVPNNEGEDQSHQ